MSDTIKRLRDLMTASVELKPSMVEMVMREDPSLDIAKAQKWVGDQAKFEQAMIMTTIEALVTGVPDDTVAHGVVAICGAIVGTIYFGSTMPNSLFEDVLRAAVVANHGGGLIGEAEALKRVKA